MVDIDTKETSFSGYLPDLHALTVQTCEIWLNMSLLKIPYVQAHSCRTGADGMSVPVRQFSLLNKDTVMCLACVFILLLATI